jgi:hypothetical protein
MPVLTYHLFSLDFDNLDTPIVTTPGTYLVRQPEFAAVRACHQVSSLEGVMAATLALAALTQFSFR